MGPADFTEVVVLKYERLPGYEGLSQREYRNLMMRKLAERQSAIVEARYLSGKGFVGRESLLRTRRGALPRKSKQSDRGSHRPRVLSLCDKTRAEFKSWYFEVYFEYKEASREYRAGKDDVRFPRGTYPPWRPLVPLFKAA